MKFTIVALISALAAVSTAEFCDNGAAGVGACENIDKNTFCVSLGWPVVVVCEICTDIG